MISSIIVKAFENIGIEGNVEVIDSPSSETRLIYEDAFIINAGFFSSFFINRTENNEVIFENPLILICNEKLINIDSFIPIITKVANMKKPFVVFAKDFSTNIINLMLINKEKKDLQCAAIKLPGLEFEQKEWTTDLSIYSNSETFENAKGHNLKKFRLMNLGSCKKIKITKEKTFIYEGTGEKQKIETFAKSLLNLHKSATIASEKERLYKRYARLSGKTAKIMVGGYTKYETANKKEKFLKGISSCRAALINGYTAGGGVALLHASYTLNNPPFKKDKAIGIKLIKEMLKLPKKLIIKNSGKEPSLIIDKIIELGFPYGFNTENYEISDMLKANIVDPVFSLNMALEKALSISKTLLNTKLIISTETVDKMTDEEINTFEKNNV